MNVLVVGDDPDILELANTLLTGKGFSVVLASTYRKAKNYLDATI